MVWLLACVVAPQGVEATVSDTIPTVVTVRWTTAEPTTGRVEYGDGLVTPDEDAAATEHEAVLLGLPPETDDSAIVVLSDGTASEPVAFTTGALPNTLPTLETTGSGNDRWIVTSVLGSTTGPAILSPDGVLVWYYPETSGLDVYRARLSRDGGSVLYNAASVSGDPAPDSAIVRVSLDGGTVERTTVPYLAHDFVELDDGSVVVMAVEYGGDDDAIRGDQLVRIDGDGAQTQIWSAWDCFDPTVDIGTDQTYGWTFANALDHDAAADDFLLNLRNFSSIVRIDPDTRTCPWVFGSTAATVQPEGEIFFHEHQFEVLDGEILVFDNEGAGGRVSRVLGYTWAGGPTATATWTYTADPSIYTFVLGDVARLDDGDTLVDWATGGGIDRVAPDGTATWTVRAGVGGAFGFMTPQATPYR